MKKGDQPAAEKAPETVEEAIAIIADKDAMIATHVATIEEQVKTIDTHVATLAKSDKTIANQSGVIEDMQEKLDATLLEKKVKKPIVKIAGVNHRIMGGVNYKGTSYTAEQIAKNPEIVEYLQSIKSGLLLEITK